MPGRRRSEVVESRISAQTCCIEIRMSGPGYAANGMYAQAAAEFARFSDLTGGALWPSPQWQTWTLVRGPRKQALTGLHRLRAISSERHVPAYPFTIVYAGLGETGEALNWLAKAYE